MTLTHCLGPPNDGGEVWEVRQRRCVLVAGWNWSEKIKTLKTMKTIF